MIIAHHLAIYMRDGNYHKYTHVTRIDTIEKGLLFIMGETDDVDGMRVNAIDKFPTKDIHIMTVEFAPADRNEDLNDKKGSVRISKKSKRE